MLNPKGRAQWLLVALAMSIAVSAFGQNESEETPTGNSRVLEEVTVTARKRAESLLDVPVTVVALSRGELENNVAVDLSKIAELSPQVVVGRAIGGTGSLITIRGISSSSSDSGLDQSVAIDYDGVPLSRGRIISASMFDMEQVEILQGPQALFFGKNSPAGVISMRSASPGDTFESYVLAGYEFNANERFVEGAVSGPLSDTFSARLAVRWDKMDGWMKNVAQPIDNPFNPAVPLPGALGEDDMPAGHDVAARLTLDWAPTDNFGARFKLTVNEQELNSNGAFTEGFCIDGKTIPTQLGVPMPYADCEKNKVKAESALPPEYAGNYPYGNGGLPYTEADIVLGSLNLSYDFGDLNLTSTTGYYDQEGGGAHNADFSPFILIFATEREDYSLFTQELRLSSQFDSPLNFMVGAYYEQSDRDWLNAPDIFQVYNPISDNYTTNVQTSVSDNESFSVFGQFTWEISETLELTGGARYTDDSKDSSFVNEVNNPNSGLAAALYPQGQVLEVHYADDNVSPELTLSWHPNDDQMGYVAYKTGYKSGGISNAALFYAVDTAESKTFGPEEVDGFEVGYKASLAGQSLRLDLTAYRYNYDGLQVTSFSSSLFRYTVGNAASARTEGVTGMFKWLATDQISLNGSVGFNRAKYEDFKNAQCYTGQTEALGCVGGVQDLSGHYLNRAPKLTASLGGEYEATFNSGWTSNFSAGAYYTSSYQTATDEGPGGEQPSYWRVNAAVHVRSPDRKYDFALIGRNLNDAYYMVFANAWPGTGAADQYIGIFNRPREVVLQASYHY